MPEYSRMLIEQYCAVKRKRKLARLVKLSYDPGAEVTDADAPENRMDKKGSRSAASDR